MLVMAVGIIIGGAFTAIITALVNNILTPLLQMIPGMTEGGVGALQVVLKDAVIKDGVTVTEAVVLDFGVVISAFISFLLTALVLFVIIKMVNRVHTAAKQAKEEFEAMKAGAEQEAPAEEPAPAAAPEVPAAPPAPTTEELLAEIRDLLKAEKKD